MRTLLATAPPRYPVRRIAPKIAVLGIVYRIVLTRRTIPSGRMTSCGYPIFVVASTTWCSIASFEMASNSMNNTVRPLIIRPVQSQVFELGALVCVFVDMGQFLFGRFTSDWRAHQLVLRCSAIRSRPRLII